MKHLVRTVGIGPFFGFLALVCLAAATTGAFAQDSSTVVRVEEDWELIVDIPEPDKEAPQVACLISPVGNAGSVYALFTINHHTIPEYVAGGLQLQIWNGSEPLTERSFRHQTLMHTQGETVTWTQAMEINGNSGTLEFEVLGGASTTWGEFGVQDNLKISVATPLQNLNEYSPEVSTVHSDIEYADNLARSLTLKRIRVYTADGEMVEFTTPLVVYPPEIP